MTRERRDVDATDCKKVLTLPQYTGTCWFNAVFMALFYSQGTRRILLNAASHWVKMMKKNKYNANMRQFFMMAIEILQKHCIACQILM